jgi:hypothetical protein
VVIRLIDKRTFGEETVMKKILIFISFLAALGIISFTQVAIQNNKRDQVTVVVVLPRPIVLDEPGIGRVVHPGQEGPEEGKFQK